ncbi:MAG: MBOAT family protein [Spirochaetales bacterium]|nr:MBOAT family protein [Spirochaetales bacterium]
MIFPTLEFAVFFLFLFLLYWQIDHSSRWRNWLLILASFVFYAAWDYRFVPLLFLSCLANWVVGYFLGKTEVKAYKITLLVLGLFFNLEVLFSFKYMGFFLSTLNNLGGFLGISFKLPVVNLILPVGISFFTFQGMSYVIDIYRGEVKASRQFSDILLYISFFPQLVAGPIVRAGLFLPQIQQKKRVNEIAATHALVRIFGGLIKKTFIAHYLSVLLVDPVFASPLSFTSLDALLALYGYALQIYCDFSAYSDMALGLAALLGFEFPENFNRPYLAQSLREFWRRWHISLSTWLRDYLYIPLGGSRKGKTRAKINLLITMFLGGIWHGPNLKYLIWGFLHGAALVFERWLGERKKHEPPPNRMPVKNMIFSILKGLAIFHFVCLLWIFFRAEELSIVGEYLRALAAGTFFQTQVPLLLFIIMAMTFLAHFVPAPWCHKAEGFVSRMPILVQGILAVIMMLLLGVVLPEGVAPFIYYQF